MPALPWRITRNRVHLLERFRVAHALRAAFAQLDRYGIEVLVCQQRLHRLDTAARDVRGAKHHVVHPVALHTFDRLVVQVRRGGERRSR